MSFLCKGFCTRYKSQSKYADGVNVQCIICDVYYKADLVVISPNNGKRCFCCGCYVRKKRRTIRKNVTANRI